MTAFPAEYIELATAVANKVVSKVMPVAEMPEALLESYNELAVPLLEDKEGVFSDAWNTLPESAKKLMQQAEFHGFYVAQVWLRLSMAGQEIAELANTDNAIDDHAYNGLFLRIVADSLKDSIKKLKKARTDRALLNGFYQTIA